MALAALLPLPAQGSSRDVPPVFYLHDHLVPVQLDADRNRVCQKTELVYRAVVDANLQSLPVNLGEPPKTGLYEGGT